jgi:hypothetical protein
MSRHPKNGFCEECTRAAEGVFGHGVRILHDENMPENFVYAISADFAKKWGVPMLPGERPTEPIAR